MSQKIAVMEQKSAEEAKKNMITNIFRFLVFVRFIPVRLDMKHGPNKPVLAPTRAL